MTNLEPKTSFRPSLTLDLAEQQTSIPARPRSLAHAVQAAVRAMDENALRPVARRAAGLAFQPKTLLALLSYCYARQIYGSVDAEDLLRRDMDFRHLCHDEFPGARILRCFRRENREALRLCLLAALRFLAERVQEAGIVTHVEEAHLAEQASRRITMAMFIDSMELDED